VLLYIIISTVSIHWINYLYMNRNSHMLSNLTIISSCNMNKTHFYFNCSHVYYLLLYFRIEPKSRSVLITSLLYSPVYLTHSFWIVAAGGPDELAIFLQLWITLFYFHIMTWNVLSISLVLLRIKRLLSLVISANRLPFNLIKVVCTVTC